MLLKKLVPLYFSGEMYSIPNMRTISPNTRRMTRCVGTIRNTLRTRNSFTENVSMFLKNTRARTKPERMKKKSTAKYPIRINGNTAIKPSGGRLQDRCPIATHTAPTPLSDVKDLISFTR